MLVGILPACILLFVVCVAWFNIIEGKQVQIAKDLEERRKQIPNKVKILLCVPLLIYSIKEKKQLQTLILLEFEAALRYPPIGIQSKYP